jgi:hypothetical protein
MSKKWYEHFITIENGGEAAPDGPVEASSVAKGPPGAKGSGSAAQAIADIAATIQSPPPAQQQQMVQVAAKAAAPNAAPLSLTDIYTAADITAPPHGYTVIKVAEMLQSVHIKDLPAEVRKSSVLVALEAAGVKIQQIVEDAVRRDKALDTFERLQQKQVEDFEAAKLEENRKHQAEMDRLIADLKLKMESNQKAVAQRKEAFQAWRIQKQLEEQRIADAIGHFVTENPITTSRG